MKAFSLSNSSRPRPAPRLNGPISCWGKRWSSSETSTNGTRNPNRSILVSNAVKIAQKRCKKMQKNFKMLQNDAKRI